MTSEKPDVKLDGRYSITEASRALKVSLKTMSRWGYGYVDANGVFRKPKISAHLRKSTNKSFFLGRDITALWAAEH